MKIDLTKLLTNQIISLNINDDVNIPKELFNNSLIDELKDIKILAKITLDEEDNLILEGNLSGTMMLKDDLTLEPVAYNFNTDIEENISKLENVLDITDILWQNIMVEIPSKVRKTDEDIYLSGNGWRVISEDIYNEEKRKKNNPFQELDELLKTKEDK